MSVLSALRNWFRFATITAGAVLTSGCNDMAHQRELAVTGAREFWARYQAGAFGEAYDEAAAYVHRKATREWWVAHCAAARAQFGTFRDFTPVTNNQYPFGRVGIVWVSGPTIFDSGQAKARLDFDIASGRPKLFNIQLERGSSTISIPGYTQEVFK